MAIRITLLLAFTSGLGMRSSAQVMRLSLNENWSFSEQGKQEWYKAEVPGLVHLDLFNNALIGDPYWADNEIKQRWVEKKDWVYKRTFKVDQKILHQERIELHFDGLDTYATVYLNGRKILEADNMFRSWNIDVKRQLQLGDNELKVVFSSPIKHNEKAVKRYPYPLPSGNETDDIPVKVASFTRKAAYHFGWDWGPRFVSSGIHKNVQLCAWNTARILNVHTSTESLKNEQASMKTMVEIEAIKAGTYQMQLHKDLLSVKLKKGLNKVSHTFLVEQPRLWWCNGLGEPHLYNERVKLIKDGVELDHANNVYGIRTINLINEIDSIGTSFYFELNGKPVFMKGANYIPQDLFLPRVKDQQYKELIYAVKEANMNMLRVWGGGVYERDLFYELCDQNGILVWQDFMFAGSLYPNTRAFRETVKAEIIENIKRLRSHPSLATWCGNNEIEVAWFNWGWQKQYRYSKKDSLKIWKGYKKLFHEMIPMLLKQNHPNANYTSTSPLSNWGTKENFNHSSMHYWGVWHGREPFEAFEKNVGRFMVEYGFQSFPSMETLKSSLPDSAMELDHSFMSHRQKSYIGNGLISEHIQQYYAPPKSFGEFVRLSQEVQALGMQMAISSHLKAQPQCMGSLFWQLNDCWPGPSWSTIDYFGRKKKAYEIVKKEFAK